MTTITDRPGLQQESRPKWGHVCLTPEGEEIRLPKSAIDQMDLLGLLSRTGQHPQMSVLVYEFMHPDYESLLNGIRRILGRELEGPEWLLCDCRDCLRKQEDADKTPMPRRADEKPRGRYWLKVIRDPNRN